MNIRFISFIIFVLITITSCTRQDLDTYLSELHENKQLNGNVLVVKSGNIIYERSFGFTDGTRDVLLSKDHRFNIGSIYKEFPAVAIMQLVEAGKIKTSDKISDFLPELPSWGNRISIKNLLQYSSGLPKENWDTYIKNDQKITVQTIFKELSSIKHLDFDPGTDYTYTNYSPVLLSLIVERVAEINYRDYAQQNLFDPYGLKDFVIKTCYPYKDEALMAIPFNSEFVEDSFKIDIPWVLYSASTKDLYQWLRHLDDFDIISKESVRVLSQEAKIGNNIQAPLGRCDWEDGKIVEHFHHGSTANYECVARNFKQEQIIIIILTNQKNSNVNDISENIYEIVKRDF